MKTTSRGCASFHPNLPLPPHLYNSSQLLPLASVDCVLCRITSTRHLHDTSGSIINNMIQSSQASQPPPPVAVPLQRVSEQMLSFGSRLAQSISRDSMSSTASTATTAFESNQNGSPERDTSHTVTRGRQMRSSGRGGAGNIRLSPSASPLHSESTIISGPGDFSTVIRGGELGAVVSPAIRTVSTGRGGVGNIFFGRSTSRDSGGSIDRLGEYEYERRLLQERANARASTAYVAGRGGAGNIKRTCA